MSGLRFAYADPPYVGQAKRHYGKEATYAGEVDHEVLLDVLRAGRYDGWAISASSPSLFHVLSKITFPEGTRIAAWVKPFHAYKRGIRPAYAWEPVIFWGGRNKNHPPPLKGGKATTPKDFIRAHEEISWLDAPAVPVNITLQRGLVGAKPEAFCFWLFDILGMKPGDEFADLFPGTGAVSAAHRKWEATFVLDSQSATAP